ncbi:MULTISPECIES: hypothetical protein [unclassified Ensifer]|uniref:hypothetical protein n=1 Tax=unclassified Ensifer TaxID=2633371 RepID=UPI000A79CAE0|nr:MULTISPECIES: hypothetical protein [unclassified Ensifer]
MNLDYAKAKYHDVCNLLGLSSEEWCESYDMDSGQAEICAKEPMTGEIVPIAHILKACGYDDRRIMTHAPTYLRALVFLLQHAFREIRDLRRQLEQRQEKPKDFAAECAMKCAEPAFKKFLGERHGLQSPLTNDRAATRVRSILAISSRRQLNEDATAAERWKNLRSDFDAWRQYG